MLHMYNSLCDFIADRDFEVFKDTLDQKGRSLSARTGAL